MIVVLRNSLFPILQNDAVKGTYSPCSATTPKGPAWSERMA